MLYLCTSSVHEQNICKVSKRLKWYCRRSCVHKVFFSLRLRTGGQTEGRTPLNSLLLHTSLTSHSLCILNKSNITCKCNACFIMTDIRVCQFSFMAQYRHAFKAPTWLPQHKFQNWSLQICLNLVEVRGWRKSAKFENAISRHLWLALTLLKLLNKFSRHSLCSNKTLFATNT